MAKEKIRRLMGCFRRAISLLKKRQIPYKDNKALHSKELKTPSPLERELSQNRHNLDNSGTISTPSTPSTPSTSSTTELPISDSSHHSTTPQPITSKPPRLWLPTRNYPLNIYLDDNPFHRDPDPNQDQFKDWLRGPHGALPRGRRASIKGPGCIPLEHPEYQDEVMVSSVDCDALESESGSASASTGPAKPGMPITLVARVDEGSPCKYFDFVEVEFSQDRAGAGAGDGDGDGSCCSRGFCPRCVLGVDGSVSV